MRVPEAKSNASINTLSTPTASPTAFGAGIGRAIEGMGQEMTRQSAKVADVVIKAKEMKVIREAEDAYADLSFESENWYNDTVASKLGRDTDEFDGQDNFGKNISNPLKEMYTKRIDGMSENAAQRLGVMFSNRRMAIEKRAANHLFTQQTAAAKQASVRALDAATDGYAIQARQYTKKQPDGSVHIEEAELARLMPDVIAAQKIYHSRHGIINEVELPDGSKQNILVKTARAGAHEKAISGMMSAGEFDEAEAYLNAITESETYKDDLDEKQVNITRKAITDNRKAMEEAANAQSNQTVTDFVNQNARMPNLSEQAQMGLTPETLTSLRTGKFKVDPKIELPTAIELRAEMLAYDPEEDPDGSKHLALAQKIESFSSTETKTFLRNVLKRATSVEAAKTDDILHTEIEEAMLGMDFRFGIGDGFEGAGKKGKEKVRLVQKELAIYDEWVKESNPTVQQRFEYLEKGRFADMKAASSMKAFRRASGKQTRLNFSPSTVNSSQAVYLDDDSSLNGLLH